MITHVNMYTFEEMNNKSPRTKDRASREEREARNCLESVSNSRTTFQIVTKSNKWLATRARASNTGHNQSFCQPVDLH